MTFEYTARDPLGRLIEGTLDVSNRDMAMQNLRRDGFQILKIEESDDGGSLFPRRVKRSDIVYFTSQLAIMVQTGIKLSEALNGIADQEDNPTLKSILLELKGAVESGEDFSTALSRFPKHFDRTFVALIRSSEETGLLGEMLEQISIYLNKQAENRGKIRAAMTYPAVMLFLASGITLFLLTYIMPKFTPLFKNRGIDLPLPTVVLMTISDALVNYWYAWILGAIAVTVGFALFRRTTTGRQTLDWLKIHIPIVGPLIRKVIISRCISTLGTMVRSGVQILDAIKLTGNVSGNYYYEQSWQHVHDEVTTGNRICESLRNNSLYPRTLVQMIGSGEETGQLDTVLKKVSSFYDREVDSSIKTVSSLIEPLMITIMGAVVGTIGLSILLPIFSLSRMAG